jgi:threonine dehydrogenase-like Zn-dependent dehydrogenase
VKGPKKRSTIESIEGGRLDPTKFTTHQFPMADVMSAYDVFADAANTKALKVVLQSDGSAMERATKMAVAVSA